MFFYWLVFHFFALQKVLKFDFFNALYSRFNFPNFIEFSIFHQGLIVIASLFLIGFTIVLFKFF